MRNTRRPIATDNKDKFNLYKCSDIKDMLYKTKLRGET